jgi:pilus assembly protein CpaC
MKKVKREFLSLALVLLAVPAVAGAIPQFALPTSEGLLRVFVGKSLLVSSPEPLVRVSITDSAIASAVITTPNQVMIHGIVPGTVTLLLWDEEERARAFDLQVEIDVRSIRQTITQVFPGEAIQVGQLGSSLVLTGQVSSDRILEQATELGQAHTPDVVNLLGVLEKEKKAVLLQVRFAEVDRAAIQELGINIFSTGAGNTLGTVSTQQFGPLLGNVGSVPAGVSRGSDPNAANLASGGIGNQLGGSPAVFGLSDLLNIFIFRPDANIGVTIRALEQRNVLEILAEPNVLALDGSEASFLAGGEFPFPIVQGGNFTAVTIVFKEFGVRLRFTPRIQEDGKILLKVMPEVSSLDFANALVVSGFLIPALSTRRAETEVLLRDGQTFAIAGLIDNRLTEIASKVPFLGDIPVIGKLFRSRAQNRNTTELMVMVTPRIVEPFEPGEFPPDPEFPIPLFDEEESDQGSRGTAGETQQAEVRP